MAIMTKTLELAIEKAKGLPEAAQDQLGRELLERIDTLDEMRSEIGIGIEQLDAGRATELDIEKVIEQARPSHGRSR